MLFLFRHNKKGLTLIEVLLVVTILAIFGYVVIMAINPKKHFEKVDEVKKINDIRAIKNALDFYIIEKHQYPASLDSQVKLIGTAISGCDVKCNINGSLTTLPTQCVDLSTDLVSDFLTQIPAAPNGDANKTLYAARINAANRAEVFDCSMPTCNPDCTGKICGDDDGCGGICNTLDTSMDNCTNGVAKCGANPACSSTADTCSGGTCLCGTNPSCSGNSDTCNAGVCMCGSNNTCTDNTDTCNNGNCLCGVNPACSDSSDTCSGGVCLCGVAAACTGGLSCSAGACIMAECPSNICGDGSSLVCGATNFNANGSLTLNSSNASAYETETTYSAIKIGTQCWMNKNINIGYILDTAGANPMNTLDASSGIRRYCWQGSDISPNTSGTDTSKCLTDGGIYTWSMAMYLPSSYQSTRLASTYYINSGAANARRQGICPKGWHVPSDSELAYLENYVQRFATPTTGSSISDGTNYYADKMGTAGTIGWRGSNNASGPSTKLRIGGSSSLNIPLVGSWYNGSFMGRTYAYLWSSSHYNSTDSVWVRRLTSTSPNNNRSYRYSNTKTDGNSLRCLKDY